MKKSLLAISILGMGLPMGNGGEVIQLSYPSLDDIPEPFRPLYSEANGAYTLTGVSGIKTQADIDRISGALAKERNDFKAFRERYNGLKDLDPAEILQKLDAIPALEEAAKAGGNVDNLVGAKLKQHTAPLERQISDLQAQLTVATEQVQVYQQRERSRLIGDAVIAGATATKALPEAVDDLRLLATNIFEVTEDGKVVAKEGIPGVTPGISPEVWLTDMKRSKPFYWPVSQGANGRGGTGGSGGTNPWSKESWNMTEQGRILVADPKKAEQLAAQAGTSIGGPKPA